MVYLYAFVIFIFSTILRFSYFDLIEYKADQALTIWQLMHGFSPVGLVSSTGMYNFPLFNYLMTPFAMISFDPQFLTGIITLVNCFSLVGLFLVLKKYFKNTISFLVTIFISSSPWMILYSRSIWAQNLLLPFLVIWLYCLLEIVLRKNNKIFLLFGIVSSLIIQVHSSGLFLLAATIISLKLGRVVINKFNFVKGFFLGLIPAIPWFFTNGSSLSLHSRFDVNNFLRPVQIFSGAYFKFILGKEIGGIFSYIPLLIFVFIIPLFFVIKNNKAIRVFVLIFILLPILYFLTKTTGYMHYYIVAVPIVAVLICFAGRLFYKIVLASLSLAVASNIFFVINFFQTIDHQKIVKGDYGPAYIVTKDILDKETEKYKLLPEYEEIRTYTTIKMMLGK